MTFGPHHYVPVLKVKRGEKGALRAISPTLRPRITPLSENVERTNPTVTVDQHLDTTFKDLADSVQPYLRSFLDAREIASDGPQAAADVFNMASAAGIVFTPVTGVTRSADVAAALSYRSHGVALRLTRQEFESGRLLVSLPRFLSTHGLTAEEIELIIDLGPVDDLVTEGSFAQATGYTEDLLLMVGASLETGQFGTPFSSGSHWN